VNAQDYQTQLLALQPPGVALPADPGSTWGLFQLALAEEFARVDARALALLEETDPRTVYELLADWERASGLPDGCVTAEQTIAERRAALVAKWGPAGNLSRQYFIDFAARLGYDGPYPLGTAQAGSSTSITLSVLASSINDVYNGMIARAVSGAGSVQERNIAAYNGISKVAAISPRWSTNMLSYPSQFDNAVWTKANATITPNVISASDGTLTADKLVENTSNSVHDVSRLNISGSVDGDTAIVVAEVKKAERIGVQLYCQRRDTTPSWNVTFFNFDTQTFNGTTAGCTVDVQTLPDGWYRIWLRGPLNSGTIVPDWGLRLISVWPFTTTYVGDGTSGAYVARAQIEFNQDIGDFIDGGANPVTLPDATTGYEIVGKHPVTITEYQPHTCEHDCEYPVYDDPWAYAWQVNALLDTIRESTCESSCEDPLRSWGNTALECAIARLKPGHTTVLFAYN
jgi:uncharacterized protein YmfQ (DUF2313 family)